jgi:acetolactate synthase regulatory subunit
MYELSLSLSAAEGALVRVLGLIERRGFAFAGAEMSSANGGFSLRLRIAENGRPMDVLVRQIKRLPDVREASFAPARPAFAIPASSWQPMPARAPRPTRNGLSWLGIPDRISPEAVPA